MPEDRFLGKKELDSLQDNMETFVLEMKKALEEFGKSLSLEDKSFQTNTIGTYSFKVLAHLSDSYNRKDYFLSRHQALISDPGNFHKVENIVRDINLNVFIIEFPKSLSDFFGSIWLLKTASIEYTDSTSDFKYSNGRCLYFKEIPKKVSIYQVIDKIFDKLSNSIDDQDIIQICKSHNFEYLQMPDESTIYLNTLQDLNEDLDETKVWHNPNVIITPKEELQNESPHNFKMREEEIYFLRDEKGNI